MLVSQNSWGREGGMCVAQTARVGRQVCWLVKTDGVGRQVFWSVKRWGRCVCWSIKWLPQLFDRPTYLPQLF